ncbi:MAG TPA: hypothetical protein VFZ21_25860 [Gemmatimonadaceae bacterium]|nr:hypothetical protein [Gemmatimonadaceae bacterium]
MPVGMSIQWKPLRDSHYIVASLQPGGGGLRQIFVSQSALREIQDVVRGDPAQSVVGLLLGERFECSLTLTPYMRIESHAGVAAASLHERAVSDAIRTLRSKVGVGQREAPEVLGWYCSSPSADPAVSRAHASVHASAFEERWQTVLIVGDGGNAGAFFLYDGSETRWFQAPFYEMPDPKASTRAPKPTCIAWPAYVTTASVVRSNATPQHVPSPSRHASRASRVLTPGRQHTAAFARIIVRVRRTPANAIAGVGRVAVAARRSVLDIATAVGGRAVAASRRAIGGVARVRAQWATRAAQRKAEADAARVREEERQAKAAAERRAAREEAQRRAAELEKQRAAEAEARRAAEQEARQRAAEEAERRRAAEAEARRQAAEAEARRQAEAAEARRAAEAEAERIAAEESQRKAAEEEARRKVAEEAQRKAAEEERRRAAEAEAARQAAEAEAEARQRAEEAEALRISLAVAATRRRLARPPVEGSRREPARAVGAQMADHQDTKPSDRPDRYLALAMHEGFEVSVKTERGGPTSPETFWLLHESESGLRLIVVTTDDAVRSASLHYNLRAGDDALLQSTAPEHCDPESRTIYGREECLHELRARCRRLRATGALERDWKVVPT